MRRDQEAACDARVLEARPKSERATYAGVIAELATSANGNARLALAAPMACPVLGDKSIIQRLRNISMNDTSKRRRNVGRALLVGGALALPLTASITYAEDLAEDVSMARVSQVQETLAAPPAPRAPEAPQPPEAPTPPEFASSDITVLTESDGDELSEQDLAMIEQKLEHAKAEIARAEQEIEREIEIVRRQEAADNARERAGDRAHVDKSRHYSVRRSVVMDGSGRVTTETLEEVRDGLRSLRHEFSQNGTMHRQLRMAVHQAHSQKPNVVVECQGDGKPVSTVEGSQDGQQTIFICKAALAETARNSLGGARAAIERDRNLSKDEKAEALRSLEQALENLNETIEDSLEDVSDAV
jgi:predicted nucleic acid-binding protein